MRPTSRQRSWYVRTRRSPGSPSQTIAARFRRGPLACRSRQFTDALIRPPTNHRAKGGSQSRTRSQGRLQSRRPASAAQKASGSASAVSYTRRSATTARPRNASGGGYCSFSRRRLSIVAPETTSAAPPRRRGEPLREGRMR